MDRRAQASSLLTMFSCWLCLLLCGSLLLPVVASVAAQPAELLEELEFENSQGRVRVYQEPDGLRFMQFGSDDHQTSTKNWNVTDDTEFTHAHDYVQASLLSLAFSNKVIGFASESLSEVDDSYCLAKDDANEILHVLILGLGGGNMVRILRGRLPFVNITVVELEPAVIRMAKRYFNIREDDRFRIIQGDARVRVDEMIAKGTTFDLIFNDAADENGLVKSLSTVEFVSKLRRLLVPMEGVLVTNAVKIDAENDGPEFLEGLVNVVNQVFGVESSLYLCILPGQSLIVSGETVSVLLSESRSALVEHVRQVFKAVDPREDDLYWNMFNSTMASGLSSSGPTQQDSIKQCANALMAHRPGTLQRAAFTLTVINDMDQAVDIYWDSSPRRDLRTGKECLERFPLESHLAQTMTHQTLLEIQHQGRIDTYAGDWFYAVRNESSTTNNTRVLVSCFEVPSPMLSTTTPPKENESVIWTISKTDN